jgi:hypothetical protein
MKGKGDVNVYVIKSESGTKSDNSSTDKEKHDDGNKNLPPTEHVRAHRPVRATFIHTNGILEAIKKEAIEEAHHEGDFNKAPPPELNLHSSKQTKIVNGVMRASSDISDKLSSHKRMNDSVSPNLHAAASPVEKLRYMMTIRSNAARRNHMTTGTGEFTFSEPNSEESDDLDKLTVQTEDDIPALSSFAKTLYRFFRIFASSREAKRKLYMRKIFSRYRVTVKLSLTAMTIQGVFTQASYWFEEPFGRVSTSMIFRSIYILISLSTYIVLLTNNSRRAYTFFRYVIYIFIFSGTAIKMADMNYTAYILKNDDAELMLSKAMDLFYGGVIKTAFLCACGTRSHN